MIGQTMSASRRGQGTAKHRDLERRNTRLHDGLSGSNCCKQAITNNRSVTHVLARTTSSLSCGASAARTVSVTARWLIFEPCISTSVTAEIAE